MTADEIRETFLSFFEAREHRRMPSASLVPAPSDTSTLLTVAGMQPFKPYFRGEEEPPHVRLTSCQKTFRTPDIETVGTTHRHLTFFEMLGNFSFGDYFKEGAVEYALDLSTGGFSLDREKIWITVFGGDDELGLGPDEEAIHCWRAVGVPDERIVRLGREDNFWQAGPSGPCGPCSELYLDRGTEFGSDEERPGDDTERFLEFWNLVFMQYELHADGSLTPLPDRNIDTGLGLDRLAAILQGVTSVYETTHFLPLVALGEELSGRRMGADEATTRALRILADHARGMTFLLGDGVVPSNEDRGYVLRRVMRRAVRQGRLIGIDGPVLPALCERTIEIMAPAYPALAAERETILRWAASEEEGFTRTLAQGERLLEELVGQAKDERSAWVSAEDAFKLHDTYGFPYELTKELLAEEGLAVDDQGFEELMDRARRTARSGARRAGDDGHGRLMAFAQSAPRRSDFVGYETLEAQTEVIAAERDDGRTLVKLAESPFYAEGGGQVSDSGFLQTEAGRVPVESVVRLPDDQVIVTPAEDLAPGTVAHAVVDRQARLATMANHTATHLLHASLRAQLGTHVRQAGSYVGPDKLRFDFTHGERLTPAQLAAVEEQVNGWIVAGRPVFALETTKAEAEALGAMALFGEKYGDVVRMIEVEAVSRELCGGTHVATTAEIGLFHLTAETSSASNVRRVEAVTGSVGIEQFRARTEALREVATLLRVPEPDVVAAVRKLSERVRELSRKPAQTDRDLAGSLLAGATEIAGIRVVAEAVEAPGAKPLLELSDQVKQTLGDAAVVLGCAVEGRVHLVANLAPAAVERGLRAGEIVAIAARVAGGGGGGRDTMAQAGGRDPEKLPEAIAAARLAIEKGLA